MRPKPAHPCTGRISSDGFPDFLASELGESRRNLQMFEAELGRALGASFLSLLNSGSSASLLAAHLVKHRCGKRRKVILAGFSFPTTISSFTTHGFSVRLVDTEPGGFCMDPEALRREANEDTAAIVVSHFLGFPAQLEPILKIARLHGAILVQDACETLNLQVGGRSLYDFGDLITHSFYHPHHLSTYGGGALIVNSPELNEEAQSLAHWGRQCRCHYDPENCRAPDGFNHHFWFVREGYNLEMSELNACFGRWQLKSWQSQEKRRWDYWNVWSNALAGIDGLHTWKPSTNLSPFVFPIAVPQHRFQQTTNALLDAGVEVRSLMGGCIHKHPGFSHVPHDGLRECERLGSRSFFVGIHQTLNPDDLTHAAEIARQTLTS